MKTKPLSLRVVKGTTNDVCVAQVVEIPGIIIQAKEEELLTEAAKSVCLYIKVFPDKVFDIVPSRFEVA